MSSPRRPLRCIFEGRWPGARHIQVHGPACGILLWRSYTAPFLLNMPPLLLGLPFYLLPEKSVKLQPPCLWPWKREGGPGVYPCFEVAGFPSATFRAHRTRTDPMEWRHRIAQLYPRIPGPHLHRNLQVFQRLFNPTL